MANEGQARAGDRNAEPEICVVCRAVGPRPFASIGARAYWRCDACEATFLDPRLRPSRDEEFQYYLLHDNDADDPRYRRFLAKLATPLLQRLPAAASGLDYGCGPGPALAAMLREAGHAVALYDPFFAPDRAPLERTYDFIVCTETAEHFHRPADELDRLDAMLDAGGWLAFMTCFQTDDARFSGWHYHRDPTHVVFYRAATFSRIAALRGWFCEIPVKDVALLRKPGKDPAR